MIRAKIRSKVAPINGSADFGTMLEALTWINQQMATGAYGQDDSWVRRDIAEARGYNPETLPVKTEVIDGLGMTQLFFIAKEFETSTEDVSAEYLDRSIKDYARKALEFGFEMLVEIFALNEKKGLLPEEFQALFTDMKFQQLRVLLDTGSIKTAYQFSLTMMPGIYTLAELNALREKMRLFLEENGRL